MAYAVTVGFAASFVCICYLQNSWSPFAFSAFTEPEHSDSRRVSIGFFVCTHGCCEHGQESLGLGHRGTLLPQHRQTDAWCSESCLQPAAYLPWGTSRLILSHPIPSRPTPPHHIPSHLQVITWGLCLHLCCMGVPNQPYRTRQ